MTTLSSGCLPLVLVTIDDYNKMQGLTYTVHVVVLILVTPEKLPVIFLSSHSDVLHQKNDLQAGAIEKGIHSKYVI